MRVIYLDTALDDLAWWREYYGGVFPEGGRTAGRQFLKIIALLEAHPRIGHPTDEPDVFEYVIPRTPFSLVYRLRAETLEVLRVWDGLSDTAAREDGTANLGFRKYRLMCEGEGSALTCFRAHSVAALTV